MVARSAIRDLLRELVEQLRVGLRVDLPAEQIRVGPDVDALRACLGIPEEFAPIGVMPVGRPLPDEVIAVQRRCVEIERRLASMLKPGAIPSEIYSKPLEALDAKFLENFMGFGSRRAHFLGHGVGLQIDEPPVLAEGFDEPLAEGMVLSIEPKKGVPGVGMVGTENTYRVTALGGRSLTGDNPGLNLV